jgi:hypothetical protein
MQNVFDQFDAPAGPGSGNIFDQFDVEDPKAIAEAKVRSGNAPDYRQTSMLPSGLQRFSDAVTDPFGVQDEMVGAGQFVRKLVTSGGSLDEAKQAYSDAADRVRAERRVARQDYGIAPEIAGGLATVGSKAVQAAVKAPTLLQGLTKSAKAGAGFGGVTAAAQGEGGVGNRALDAAEGAATGAVLGPVISHVALPVAGRVIGAGRDALKYANKAIQNARHPEQAAINNIADRMVKGGIDPAAVRAEVSPPPSSQLSKRVNPNTGQAFSEADMADIISRGLKGEAPSKIGADYGIHESTVNRYLTKYRDTNPTERNVIDIAKDMAGDGNAAPLTRLGRAANSLADDGETTQRLITRQQTQAGRVSNIIDRAAGRDPKTGTARTFDDEITRLDDEISTQAKAAYAAAEKNAQPFDLRPVIGKYRRIAFGRAGELREQTEKAVDAFFEPVMGPNGTVRRLGKPISDMKRFQSARQDLDQMIARSMQDGKPTPLTRNLTKLRQEVTAVVRKANPDLAAADDIFAGAKSSEKLLEQGAQLTTRLGAPSRQILSGFEKLKPEQQEMVRIGFLRKLQDMAANTRDGGAVANQFNSPAVRTTIERLFHKGEKGLYERGQQLVKNLRQEATTTRTKNDILSGSRTAELSSDMDNAMQGARAAADLATGRIWNVVNNLATRLGSQIGERGSKEVLEILTQTDPAKLLPTLNRLAQAAKTTQQRQAYVTAIRELRAANRPGVSAIAGENMGRKEQPAALPAR